MKDYMKKYNSDKQKTNKYQISLRIKASKNISDEMWSKYGYHLVDVIKCFFYIIFDFLCN